MPPKACPESFIISYFSYHVVFVLGQEPKMHMKTVSGSLRSDASVLHRFRYSFHFKSIHLLKIHVTFRNICSSASG